MAQVIKIEKNRLGNYPLFPRTTYKGIADGDVAENDFYAEMKNVPPMGNVWLIVCNREPGRTFQVFTAKSEEEFDDYLSKLQSMHETPAYIEGRTDFMVLFAGSKGHVHLTQENYREVDAEITKTRDQACRWWAKYGKNIKEL